MKTNKRKVHQARQRNQQRIRVRTMTVENVIIEGLFRKQIAPKVTRCLDTMQFHWNREEVKEHVADYCDDILDDVRNWVRKYPSHRVTLRGWFNAMRVVVIPKFNTSTQAVGLILGG